jgi:drug/metabolite transporter superfamily protein YnfA
MRYGTAMAVLFAAALLEAGGDALIRVGLHSSTAARRLPFMLAGVVVLAAYGYTVNAPPWDFGRLLGVYVAFFFVVAQVIAWIGFGQKLATTTLFGGILIIAGGAIVSLGGR